MKKNFAKKVISMFCVMSLTFIALTSCGENKTTTGDLGKVDQQNTDQVEQENADKGTDTTADASNGSGAGAESSNVDTSSPDSIIKNAETNLNNEISALKDEWETLKGKVKSYDAYVKNKEEIESFYGKIGDVNKKLCTMCFQATLDYAKAIENSGKDNEEKIDMSKDISDTIYDDLFDIINDAIYEDLFKETSRSFYKGVLDKQKDSGVEYSEWYDVKSDDYSNWYDAKSDVYEEWYNSKSDIYEFYSDLSTELYQGDNERVSKEIKKFEDKIAKRK